MKSLESTWSEGVWLGHARGSSEALIGTENGVVRAWTVRRKVEEERWSAEAIQKMRGSPAQPNPMMPGIAIPIAVNIEKENEDGEPVVVEMRRDEIKARRVYLKAEDFQVHGYTEGCDGCRRSKTGGMQARNHTEACRRRMTEALGAEEHPRWTRAKEARGEARDEAPSRRRQAKRGAAEEEEEERKAPRNEEEVHETEEVSAEPEEVSADAEEMMVEQEEMKDEEESRQGSRPGSSMDRAKRPGEDGGETQKRRKPADPTGTKRKDPEEEIDDGEKTKRKLPDVTGMKRKGEGGDEDQRGAKAKVEELKRMSKEENAEKIDIAEIYSEPRITIEAQKFGMRSGKAMDLRSGWNFAKQEDRDRAMTYVRTQKPEMVVGSPMCTMFSKLQQLTPWNRRRRLQYQEAVAHMEFVVEIYKEQIKGERYFLHEHPDGATSWRLRCMMELKRTEGVMETVADQCMYGLTTWKKGRGRAAARKRTRFMTNAECVAEELQRRCDGGHEHQPLVGGRAGHAQEYPRELCRAVCRGLAKQMKMDNRKLKPILGLEKGVTGGGEDWAKKQHDKEEETMVAWDDITGMQLDPKMVMEARKKELGYVKDKKVWRVMSRAEARRRGWKIIKTRWIDINKGDDIEIIYRSRLVAKEFNNGKEDGLFAGTPPLEALRYLVHEAATVDGDNDDKVMMINDVARAFFEAKATRTICVEIPEESEEFDGGRNVAVLDMSLYGTRDAAMNWQEEVAMQMKKWGFARGKYNPCLYSHPKWKLKVFLHGDDFASVGRREDVKKFKEKLEERFEIKTEILGRGKEEKKEARVLNRTIRVTDQGWEYEPDQRHVEIIVDMLGLKEAKPVETPTEDLKKWEEEENDVELESSKATKFRSIAARCNYLAADRPDLMFAVKEVCREMSSPTVGAWKKLKRIGRYLAGHPRTILRYDWQGREAEADGFTDSDWAGCRKTGKSTSGGVVMIGSHFIKGWSRTQNSVTLSSAEAELVAMCKLSAELLGIISLARDLDDEIGGKVWADSSAALAIAKRKGAGKLRHINIGMLWIQEVEKMKRLDYKKVAGELNPADLMTKGVAKEKLRRHMRAASQEEKGGRAERGLRMREDQQNW
jgi:hypothetical protein